MTDALFAQMMKLFEIEYAEESLEGWAAAKAAESLARDWSGMDEPGLTPGHLHMDAKDVFEILSKWALAVGLMYGPRGLRIGDEVMVLEKGDRIGKIVDIFWWGGTHQMQAAIAWDEGVLVESEVKYYDISCHDTGDVILFKRGEN